MVIDPFRWGADGIVSYDNRERWAVLRVLPDSPGGDITYDRLQWTVPTEAGFYTCALLTGATDFNAAAFFPGTADDSAPESGGCNGGPWLAWEPQ